MKNLVLEERKNQRQLEKENINIKLVNEVGNWSTSDSNLFDLSITKFIIK